MSRIALWIILCLPVLARGDVVILENGDRLTGAVTAMKDGKLKFDAVYGGEVEIPWQAVRTLETVTELQVQLIDETRVRGQAAPAAPGRMRLEGGEVLESVTFSLENVAAINPPTLAELGEVQTSGRVSVGLSGTSGNSETERYHVAGEFTARTGDNRYTAGLAFNRGEDDGETTVDDAIAYASYDHFLNEKWFANTALTVQKNELQNLDLRSVVGAGIGYQFRETDALKLSATTGLSYVAEDFSNAPSERAVALRWGLNYEHSWQDWLKAFHNHELLYSIEDSDDWVFISRSGLTFPIAERIDGSFQLNYDFDNSPAPGTEDEDISYIFAVGYSWD